MMTTNKKTLLGLYLLILLIPLSATTIPSGVGLAGSYLERASGIDALTLNPANIDKKAVSAEYEFFSFHSGFSENFFYAGLILGEEGRLLSPKEKRNLLNKMYKSAIARGNAHLLLAGFSFDKLAVSTSINAFGYSRFDKKVLQIILEGNEYGVHYDFSSRTGLAGILYQDITLGYGGEVINGWFGDYLQDLPDIQIGASASYLIGAKMFETDRLHSELIIEKLMDEDTKMTQSLMVRESEKGQGFKTNIGLSSQVYTWQDDHYVTAGMSFDNLFGFMEWGRNKNHEMLYELVIYDKFSFDYIETEHDSVYTEPEWENKAHTSRFPITYRFGSKYVYKDLSASFDFEQNLWKHTAFSHTPEISLGLEYIFWDRMPVQIGYRLPCWDFLDAFAFGTAYRSPYFEIGFAVSVEDSMNYKNMKGASFATYSKYRFDW